jgi:hypothetical protein
MWDRRFRLSILKKFAHAASGASKEGQFRLTRLSNNQTLLEGTTWYQHGLWPSTWWRWWSDAIIHRIHLRVLNHIRSLAEGHPLESIHGNGSRH